MAYLVLAAQRLRDDILAVDPDAEVVVLDDLDGIGRHRSIRVEGDAAKEFAEALDIIGQNDDRIAEVVKSSHGVRVTMVGHSRADYTEPFPVAEAIAALSEE